MKKKSALDVLCLIFGFLCMILAIIIVGTFIYQIIDWRIFYNGIEEVAQNKIR